MSLYFTKEHEWVRIEGDTAVMGITTYAAEQLGDVVYVDLPDVGKDVAQNGEVAAVESVKAASEVYAPVSGAVTAVNEALNDAPETVNADPEGAGWFVKLSVKDAGELSALMDEAAYKAFVAELA